MRAVLQRVSEASVKVDDQVVGQIGRGWLVLLGVGEGDDEKDIDYLADKIINLRLFPDEAGKFNFSVADIKGEILVVSQFTLHADCRKGRRPNFSKAAKPEVANTLYEKMTAKLATSGLKIATGKFQATMKVSLINDGPVTIVLDSELG